MAHELDMSNGRANMAYAGVMPWHGLGNEISPDEDIDTWKVQAGMNWNVNPADLIYKDEDDNQLIFPQKQVLFRSDTKAPLSVVSDAYRVVQPGEVLEFFRDLISGQGFKMETAGCLFGGKKFWALASTGESVRIMGQDEVKPYLLMASSCDGSMSTVAHFTSVRVVCNNTLRMSVGDSGQLARIRIPHSATFVPEQVKEQMGVAKEVWSNFVGSMEILASMKLDRDEAIQIVADELKSEWAGENPEQLMEESTVLRRIIRLYDGEGLGAQYKSSNGTAWGLVNAVTQFFDHETGTGQDKSRAFERAHLTDRAKLKVAVADQLLRRAA